jgi:hypothetical protein
VLLLLGVERGLFSKHRAGGRLHCAVERHLFEGVAHVDIWEGGEVRERYSLTNVWLGSRGGERKTLGHRLVDG